MPKTTEIDDLLDKWDGLEDWSSILRKDAFKKDLIKVLAREKAKLLEDLMEANDDDSNWHAFLKDVIDELRDEGGQQYKYRNPLEQLVVKDA